MPLYEARIDYPGKLFGDPSTTSVSAFVKNTPRYRLALRVEAPNMVLTISRFIYFDLCFCSFGTSTAISNPVLFETDAIVARAADRS